MSFADKIFNILGEAAKIGTKTADVIKDAIEEAGGKLFLDMEQMQVETARSFGMTYEASSRLLDVYSALNRTGMGEVFGMNQEKLFEMHKAIGEATNRNLQISEEAGWDIGAMRTVMDENSVVDLIGKLDLFGQNAIDASEYVGKIYKKAGEYGLSFEEYSKNFKDNLALAQKYTFKDGLEGLERMAKKSTEIKLSMEAVGKFAEKMWTGGVQGAIDSAAKLQVLGGEFASLADPLSMLNEGLNNFEGLNDRIVGMFDGVGRFNRENGQVEIGGQDKFRMRYAAEAMGMSYDDLSKMVMTRARQNAISEELEYYGGIDERLKEKLKNIGTFEGGRAGAVINGSFKNIEEISASEDLQKELLAQGYTEEESIRNIASHVRSINERISNWQKAQNGGIGEMQKSFITDFISRIEPYTYLLVDPKANFVNASLQAGYGVWKKGIDISNIVSEGSIKGNGGPVPEFGDGGMVSGPSHAEGGITAAINDIPAINLEGGEFIVNKESASQYGNVLRTINDANKPYSNMPSPSGLYGNGGYIANVPQAEINIGDIIAGEISPLAYTITPVEENNQTISSTERNMTYEKVAYNGDTYNANTNNYGGNGSTGELKVGGELTLNIKGDNVVNDTKKIDFVKDVWEKLSPSQQMTIVNDIVRKIDVLPRGVNS